MWPAVIGELLTEWKTHEAEIKGTSILRLTRFFFRWKKPLTKPPHIHTRSSTHLQNLNIHHFYQFYQDCHFPVEACCITESRAREHAQLPRLLYSSPPSSWLFSSSSMYPSIVRGMPLYDGERSTISQKTLSIFEHRSAFPLFARSFTDT